MDSISVSFKVEKNKGPHRNDDLTPDVPATVMTEFNGELFTIDDRNDDEPF